MKIYILRHEDRTQDATLFSPLTKNGLDRSLKLAEVLKKKDVDVIFSSPYIRTLQTVYPFAKERNKKINLEYSLSEIQHPHLIPEKSYTVSLPSYIAESFNYNENYTSILEPEDHKYPEDQKNVSLRIKKFLNKIMTEYLTTKKNILIVTHQAVCNSILKIATKNTENSIDFDFNYPKGGLTQVWDLDQWTFKPINWEN